MFSFFDPLLGGDIKKVSGSLKKPETTIVVKLEVGKVYYDPKIGRTDPKAEAPKDAEASFGTSDGARNSVPSPIFSSEYLLIWLEQVFRRKARPRK